MNRRAYIFTRDGMVRPQLLWWLEDHGFQRHRDIVFVQENRDQCVAYAAGIKKAVDDGVDMAVFCDCDAIPHAKATDTFFRVNRYHVQCVKYDTECAGAFDRYDAFHSLIWRASRDSLRKMVTEAQRAGLRLCEWNTSPLGDIGTECACASIERLAKACGLSTGWIGTAIHFPKAGNKLPRMCVFGE